MTGGSKSRPNDHLDSKADNVIGPTSPLLPGNKIKLFFRSLFGAVRGSQIEKLWRIRFQSDQFEWNNSSVHFCYFASKIDGCKGATFGSVNKKLDRFCFLPEKVAPLHPPKFGNVQGKYFHIC